MYVQARGVNLSCVRSCVVIAEERPRLALTQPFSKLFKDLGLSPRAVSTAFGARVNLAICLQVGAKKFIASTLHHARAGPYFDFCLLLSGHCWSRPIHCLCRHDIPPAWQVCVRWVWRWHEDSLLHACSVTLSFFLCHRVRLVERGAPQSLLLMESGTVRTS